MDFVVYGQQTAIWYTETALGIQVLVLLNLIYVHKDTGLVASVVIK